MNLFENLVATDITATVIVHLTKGEKTSMTNRKNFGLAFCQSGQVTYTMNNKAYSTSEGYVAILPKGATYTVEGKKEGYFPVVNFDCENFNCNEIMILQLNDTDACLKEIDKLKNLLANNNRLKAFSVFYGLLNKLSFENGEHTPLDSAFLYIEKNISNPHLTNTEIAKSIGISEVYLRKLFNTHCNTSPKQYILNARINKAKELLLTTPYSITAISEECGFSGVYHFSRAFKEHTGLTPSRFSAQNRFSQI